MAPTKKKNGTNGRSMLNNVVEREYQFMKVDLEVDEIDWEDETCTPQVNEHKDDNIALKKQKREEENEDLRYQCMETQTDEEFMRHINQLQNKEINFKKMKDQLEGCVDPFSCLADEIIMKIFSYLSTSTLRNCVLVCTRWKAIGYDRSFWKLVNLDYRKITKNGLLGTVLHRGVEILRLSRAEILAPICLNDCPYINGEKCPSFPLTHLDASVTKFTDDHLTNLLFKCESLQNLSLEGCKIGVLEITAISMNSRLRVLNLSNVIGLTGTAVDAITRRCCKLRSLNLSWTNQTRDALRYISRCKRLEELNVSGLRGGIDRKVMEKLVTSCPKLKALDFSDVTLQIGTLKLIADNSLDLRKLSISRCTDVKAEQLFELVKLKRLSHLNLFGFVNSEAITRFMNERPDIYVNKEAFSTIARPISTARYQGRLWEQYVGFII